MEKREICRKYYKELRNAMSKSIVAEKSRQICERVLLEEGYQRAEVIYGYYPLGNEVNCRKILEQAIWDGKRVVLPKTGTQYQMEFYEIKNLETDVEEGKFHIMEPKSECSLWNLKQESLKTEEILILVPGVVFDRQGNRYGYGRGFYDRYFERYPKLKRMALSYELQLANEPLVCLKTDKKMHWIVTENAVLKIAMRESYET